MFFENWKLVILPFFLMVASTYLSGQRQTQTDSYTRYELLEPESHRFRIIYDVSATTPGAAFYYNSLRKGSEHEVHSVLDLMSGSELEWEIVDGVHAQSNGHPTASSDGAYLKVILARPVPDGGQARLRIDKTYMDPNSYFFEGDMITFNRSLGIKRNAVVLPFGYEIISCIYPSQVEQESSGRIKTSFMNRGTSTVGYQITAKKIPGYQLANQKKSERPPWPSFEARPSGRDKSHARLNYQINERAFQNRDIVYFLQQPETHSFRLYHDYTESRVGMDRYLNVVRAGSKASNPSAIILDTGEKLIVETLKGDEITKKGIQLNGPITDETEVVVIWYDPVKEGQSIRLRIEETYTDPHRYLEYNGELVWDRSFGRNRNTVVLPEGWRLTNSSIPALIDQTENGQPRLYFVNDRPENIDVFIKAERR